MLQNLTLNLSSLDEYDQGMSTKLTHLPVAIIVLVTEHRSVHSLI